MDKVSLDRIQLLHPKVRDEVLYGFLSVNKQLLGKGIRLRLAYTIRTFDEQDALYTQGRTKLFDNTGKRLGKITQAKGGQSIHNYGLAFDIVLLIDKNNDGIFESASWDTTVDWDKDSKADWMEVVDYFKSVGWIWGGDWKSFKDKPHFEKTFGHDWKTLLAKYNKKDFISGTKFVNI